MYIEKELLIVGAGPYGLGIANYAQSHGIDYLACGIPFEFWEKNMPEGMLLRSGIDWHIDAVANDTFENFAEMTGRSFSIENPIPRDFFSSMGNGF